MKDLIIKALKAHHFSFSDTQIEQFDIFLHLLQKWNRAFNLTNIFDPHDVIDLHLIDSLLILPHLQGSYCLDVGSGGGLPGVPLAIADPKKEWVLIDKNGKKTRFLTQVKAECGLENIKIVHLAVEKFQSDRRFDSIVSRAYTTIAKFLQSSQHLLTKNGIWIAMKGKYPKEEIDELTAGFHIQSRRLEIQNKSVERHIICIKSQTENECG